MSRTHTFMRTLMWAAVAMLTSIGASAQTWDFTTMSETDAAALAADTKNWTQSLNGETTRWANTAAVDGALIAGSSELEMTKGLTFAASAKDKIRIDRNSAIRLNGSKLSITIPSLSAGTKVTVVCETAKAGEARQVTASNLNVTQGFTASADRQTNVGTVANAGPVTITTGGGMAFYSITVEGNTSQPEQPVTPVTPSSDHSVALNTQANQMLVTTTDNAVRYYNTADLLNVEFDRAAGRVAVSGKENAWTDEYLKNVSALSFSKAISTGAEGEITNRGVNIIEARGWLESCYARWEPMEGATSYNVYVKGGKYTDYTPIDHQLVRDYGTYCRADMVGLPAGVYSLRVVPVTAAGEDNASASEATEMTVAPHDRSGFAFLRNGGTASYDGSGIGAYKENGELKDNATVIYVTAETAKTVTAKIFHEKAYKDFTGLQAILTAFEKGTAKEPLCIRLIGTITKDDMDSLGSSKEGIQVKNKNDYSPVNITIEGIGDDAVTKGFGFLIRNCASVEFRNFANMLCMDDALSFDTKNSHCWVHHMDFFYGGTGSASDQAKGDGTCDIKANSRYVTFAYNHFWDNGKTSLCGMKSESTEDYVDYHHNWFDHSDSRHPRVRTMTVHVWNNYYDGVAKYGIGATMGSSIFVESNFFRHTKDPMMISKQGTDAKGDGTFSGEAGGMIKSYGNLYAEKGSSSNYTVITQKASPADFDCFEAETRDEIVPDTYKTVSGGTTYNNFDTSSTLMHSYTPTPAANVPAEVTGYYGAGRLNKGDFKWNFTTADDTDYGVNSALKSALINYKPTLVKTF